MDPMRGEDQAWLRVMELATIYSVPMALKAAIQLHVMDILAQHGGGDEDEEHYLSAAQIASHFKEQDCIAPAAKSSSCMLDRILRVLASHGILSSSLTTSSTGPCAKPITTYGLNALSNYLLQTKDEGSLAPFVLLNQDPGLKLPFYGLHESLQDGSVPFIKAHGMTCYSYIEKDARLHHLFNCAMAGHSKLLMQALLETYNGFQDINSLVNVGGGVGACLNMITSKYPHIKGINFDLPHVIEASPQYPGVEHVGGDMFTRIPKGDAIYMKWILHNWSDEHCLKILKNCYKALPKKGKVIVVDAILPVKVEQELGARARYQMDLLMYVYFEGGKERTKEELECISKVAGFSSLQVICNIHGCSIIDIIKEDL